MSILEKINCHGDLAALDNQQRLVLCDEIRDFLVRNVSATGGHLASNLGVVELTVAIETVFNTQIDRLVFDVGHQSYVHKILTGRQADFSRLRQFGGIAGFPKPCESNTDAFVAGHASSSVSIALGMARARTLMEESYNVIALMGDGAATGGMAYEGLNDAAVSKEPMVIILNDNEMSIDKNVGGMSRHLYKLRMKQRYLGMKERYRTTLAKVPGGKGIYRVTRGMKERLKRTLLPTTIFENMGLTYLGPVDGHDLPGLISVLRSARDLHTPVLVHVMTKKGHGYLPAETDPAKFHGVGMFDPVSGEVPAKNTQTFSDAFGAEMVALAKENRQLCAVTAAMPGGTGLLDFKREFPKRLFDVGIAEEHAVSMAGGLAKQGIVPVVALYSTFLQRAYDQLLQDIGLLKLHAVFAVDRAGLVGEDGETHHGIYDVGFLRQVPGMTVLAPASCKELQSMLRWAVCKCSAPVAVRYPRGGDGVYTEDGFDPETGIFVHRRGKDMTIVTYGTIVNSCMAAAMLLENRGVDAAVIRLTKLDSASIAALRELVSGNVLVVEEICHGAGLSWEIMTALQGAARVSTLDLGAESVPHGSVAELYNKYGLDAEGIASHALEVCKGEG